MREISIEEIKSVSGGSLNIPTGPIVKKPGEGLPEPDGPWEIPPVILPAPSGG